MAVKPFTKEQLNFFKFSSLVLDESPKALRQIFITMWDTKIATKPGCQVWDDSPFVRNMLLACEGGKTDIPTNISIDEWDCTALFKATIYAKTFGIAGSKGSPSTLNDLYLKKKKPASGTFHASVVSPTGNQDETYALAIDQLRLLRNKLCHSPRPEILKADFDQYVRVAKDALTAVNLSTVCVDAIGGLTEDDFPTERVNKLNECRIQKYSFNSSRKQGRSHEVNVRAVLAFREIGKGHNAMTTFNKVMNMPAPPTRRNFTKIQNEKVLPVVQKLANDSMVNNAYNIRDDSGNDDRECGVSIDGTWQKRGYSSHNGVVTVISLDTQKCLDVEVLSDKCQQCQKWGKRIQDPRYNAWKASHKCKINHEGSAGSMETAGAVRIFERSLDTRGLKFTKMLGDGDSSTYSAIVEREPYGEDCIPEKLECIGHVQKRVGSRLRKLKTSSKGLKLADGKGLAGKGRLTDAKIDILQNYYGLAVRENLDSVENMAKYIEASLYHVASTAENPQHHLCPEGEDSWCGYNKDKEGYKHKNGIPSCIVELIKPIYKDLSNPVLLSKCTHGLTQNVNECLNGMIWDRCPKTVYVEQETVALATYLAILKFNDGDISLLKLFSDLDITPGIFSGKGAEDSDGSRIKLSAKKSTEKVKNRRKLLRHQRKHYVDSLEDKEGVSYEAGAF